MSLENTGLRGKSKKPKLKTLRHKIMCVQGTNPRQTAIPTHQSRLQGQPFRNGKVRASPCNRFQGAEGRGSLAQVILVTTIYSQRAQT